MFFKLIKAALLPAIIFGPHFILAQVAAVHLTVLVPELQANDKGVYVAGSFNYWHAGDSLYRMHKTGEDLYSIIIPVFDRITYQYKYTLGNWNRVELALNDSNIQNRSFFSNHELSITDTVLKWKQGDLDKDKVSPQMQKINAMKDSIMGKIQPELDGMLILLKQYLLNLLQEKPGTGLYKRQNKKAVKKLGEIYGHISQLFWQVFATLSPEQKKAIRQRNRKSWG